MKLSTSTNYFLYFKVNANKEESREFDIFLNISDYNIEKLHYACSIYISVIMSAYNRPTIFGKMDIYILIPRDLTRA